MRGVDAKTIAEALDLLAEREASITENVEWGKLGASKAKRKLGGSRRVPKEYDARNLERGGPTLKMFGGQMSPYNPASWFHERGIKKILRKLMPKLPDVRGCLFITLTLDRNQFSGPESAFDYTRDQIRRMFHKLRKGVTWEGKQIALDVPYFVKVEFHKDGWPHFHIVFLTRRYLPGKLLAQLWNFGRPNVKRIRNKTFHYLLKYVTKGGEVPEWVLNRCRIRIIQASKGFYLEEDSKEEKESKTSQTRTRRNQFNTIGERLAHWRKMALVEFKDGSCRAVTLPIDYQEFLNRHVLTIAQAGLYLGNETIKLQRKTINIWKKEIQNQNADYSFAE